MCAAGRAGLAAGHELFFGVLPNGLQHREPSVRRGSVGDHERLARQRIKKIERGELVIEAGHRASAVEVKPAREHRTSSQYQLFSVFEQIERPLDSVTQGLMAFESAARAD